MNVVVDTSVLSLVLRRDTPNDAIPIINRLRDLISDRYPCKHLSLVFIVGAIALYVDGVLVLRLLVEIATRTIIALERWK